MTMANRNATPTRKSAIPGIDPLDPAGVQLAVEMLDELSYETGQQAFLERKYRHGKPQRDALGEYLQKARAAGPAVEEAFTRLLSDYIAECCQSNVPDIERYRTAYLRREQVS
jgi:hypothetical protein